MILNLQGTGNLVPLFLNQNWEWALISGVFDILIFGIVLILLAAILWHPEVLCITIAFWTALVFISLGIFRIALVFNYPGVKN